MSGGRDVSLVIHILIHCNTKGPFLRMNQFPYNFADLE